MNIVKRNGDRVPFNRGKIMNSVKRACRNLQDVDPDIVVHNASIKLFEGVTTSEIDNSLIKSARALYEHNIEYSTVASRLLSYTVYKDVVNVANAFIDTGIDYHKKGFTKEKLIPKIFRYNIRALQDADIINIKLNETLYNFDDIEDAIVMERDDLITYAGAQTLADRYIHKIGGRYAETIQTMWMRIAMGLALGEKEQDDTSEEARQARTKWAIEIYNIISDLKYMPSTPTLFNSGGVRNQLSSCFLSTFEDSLEGIFDGIHQQAQLSKYAGGLGMDMSNFRVTGQDIKTMNGKTQGAIYFWKLFNDMLVAVNQSGKRRGAGAAYLASWHGEFLDFCQLKKNVGDERRRTHDMNTAAWIPDLFMEKVLKDEKWYLFSPDEATMLHKTYGAEFRKWYDTYVEMGHRGELNCFIEIDAKEVWKTQLKNLFETGGPWVTFSDPSNYRYANKHVGHVNSSNLCVTGDTMVEATVDGRNMTVRIDELVNLLGDGKDVRVYSYDTESGTYSYDTVTDGALTARDAELYEIVDDETGKSIRCTGEHKVWTTNRGYVEARNLKEDDNLLILE